MSRRKANSQRTERKLSFSKTSWIRFLGKLLRSAKIQGLTVRLTVNPSRNSLPFGAKTVFFIFSAGGSNHVMFS
jgi:hypothetical protein